MKAITLTQPWATLVAIGAKQIETRSWCPLSYPTYGPLAIHAAKGLGPVGGKDGLTRLCSTEPFCSVLNTWSREYAKTYVDLADMVNRPLMPLGAVVAICELLEVRPTRGRSLERDYGLSEQELAFGDYTEGRWAWRLGNVRMLPQPIPAKGALGLWEWQQGETP